ncbi:uncharacterized protein LOC127265173 [Andrographis paniculata]|uniref:uncharacterized protein LOC127265173 n=1 Tax=Andrographis paniculata TaxID=175694 RepID=UPI0021E7F13C|nr:uncharacterized protein LOC127265173 [Andrographis paniculata]
MAAVSVSLSVSAAPPLSSELFSSKGEGTGHLSWSSSFPSIKLRVSNSILSTSVPALHQGLIIESAWTRRSRGEAAKRPNRKSWKQRTDMYMRPFLLNVFFSKRFIHAKVMHRGTSKVISVATTNSRDLRNTLPSLTDNNACRVIGKLIAERSKEADVYAISYEVKRNERIEGRLGIILDTIQENDIIFV